MRTQTKQIAQFNLLVSMSHAFGEIEPETVTWKAMDKQFRRVEKLFGYIPGSWVRGG